MGDVAVLHPPRDIFSTNNNLPLPHRHIKPLTNRRRRSPPRHQSPISPPLNRGEDIKPDLKHNRQIGTNPVKIPTPVRAPALFYAGPVTSTSPPPSEVPLPAFFAKKSVSSDAIATNDLIRILRLDIA
ncbi:hypothetical protein CARUB_v10024322mg [Capsella rubella]|uniref:Uncharacterized protein n=2 Tax=Capsella rubella TaxID=81985 RepID=R0HVL8_9BRAS|nr:hypothetical protein CARUB_v10024322mg [Capsella rubella]